MSVVYNVGSDDSEEGTKRLAEVLQTAGADLTYKALPTGHGLTQNDLVIAAQWLQEFGREKISK